MKVSLLKLGGGFLVMLAVTKRPHSTFLFIALKEDTVSILFYTWLFMYRHGKS